jgi:signal transduction histidine kinase/integral membrane sensor domain MASE1
MLSAIPPTPHNCVRPPDGVMTRPAPALRSWLYPVGGIRAADAATFLAITVIVALVYGGAAGLGLALGSGGASLLWPAAGVAIAAIVRFGAWAMPGLLIGVLAARFAAGHSLVIATTTAFGSLTAAALGGWLLRRGGREDLPLDRVADVGVLAAAAVISAVPAALLGTLGLWAEGRAGAGAWNAFVVWWLGDAAGILLIAPILLGPAPRTRIGTVPRQRLNDLVVGTGLAACAFIAIWFTLAPNVLRFPATTACLPLLAIAAVRFGPRGAALANLFTASIVVGIVLLANRPEFNLVLVAFLAVASVTALALGAVTAERDAAVARLAADIVARAAAENKLRSARALLEATGRLARIGGWEYVIPDDRLVWSEQTYRIHSVTAGQYAPTLNDAIDFYAPEARPAVRAAIDHALATGEGWNLVVPFVTDSGRRLWVNTIGQVELRDEKPYRLFGTFQDVTERVEAERAVQESESRYHNLFESAPVAIWEEDLTAVEEWFDSLRAAGVSDLAAHLAAHPGLVAVAARMIRVRDVNLAGVQMHRAAGKAELLQNLDRVFVPSTHAAMHDSLIALWKGRRTIRTECRVGRLDGGYAEQIVHLRVPEGEGGFSRAVAIALDVTEQKRLEEQFLQAQKLEAIGRLAGGVAHDFNNLLTVINGFAELILTMPGSDSGVRELAEHIRDAGCRAADLTRQLLAFSRKQPAAARPLDLAAAVTGLCPLLAPLIGAEVRMVTRLKPVPLVLADKGHFEQVVMNLVVNARDAMPSGGTLTLATDMVEVGAGDGSDLPPGRWVVFSVADTGTGIREEVRPHLFEPFFTTKELGRGTGLGLSTVYGIVTTAGGHLRYDTSAGRGTTFRVYLPATDNAPVERDAVSRQGRENCGNPSRPDAVAGNGHARPAPVRVLLVEDVPEVRSLAVQILQNAEFAVTEASDANDAIDKLNGMTVAPDVLVTDLQMPGMNGHDLAARVRNDHPGIRVLFISGYAPESSPRSDAPGFGNAFLPKPFSPDELTKAVQGLLGQ